MEMPASYGFYSKIQEEKIVWTGKTQCARDNIDIMQMERSRNYRRSGMRGSCTSERKRTAKDEHILIYGVLEREKHAYDL